MASLTQPPGYTDNPWTQARWSKAMAATGPRFVVADANAWKPTQSTTADRTVNIAAGFGIACGVYDETDAVATVQFDPNTSGIDRYDLVISRWDWATRTRVFLPLKGTGSPPQGNGTAPAIAGAVNRLPGLMYDGVVCMVRVRNNVGTLLSTDLFDTRVWNGIAGPLVTARADVLQYIEGIVGYELLSLANSLRYRHNGSTWVGPVGSVRPQWTSRVARTGATDAYLPGAFANLVTGTWVGAPAGVYLITAQMGVQAPAAAPGTARLSVNGSILAEPRADVPADTAAAYCFIEQYGHIGGDLTYRLDHSSGGSNSVTLLNPSTKMIVALQGVTP